MTSQDIPPPQVALARRRYAEGATTRSILAESGLSLWTFYRCLDGFHDDGSGMPLPLPALPRRRVAGTTQRAKLVNRLWLNAQRLMDQIEARMAQSGLKPDDRERDARALALVVRTVRELCAFDAAKRDASREQKPKNANEQPIPRNTDDLRRELARKMEALLQEESGAHDRPDPQVSGEPL